MISKLYVTIFLIRTRFATLNFLKKFLKHRKVAYKFFILRSQKIKLVDLKTFGRAHIPFLEVKIFEIFCRL